MSTSTSDFAPRNRYIWWCEYKIKNIKNMSLLKIEENTHDVHGKMNRNENNNYLNEMRKVLRRSQIRFAQDEITFSSVIMSKSCFETFFSFLK